MTLFLFILAPITVLAILSLFGVVGCAAILGLDEVNYAPTYDGTIENEPSLVAYWRLGEPQPASFPTKSGSAKSQTGLHNGDYELLSPVTTADKAHHSPPTAGTITLGQTPGLLEKFPSQTGMQVDGGHVVVPVDPALNPPQFTFEAWVNPDIGDDDTKFPGNYYCLFESTGPPGQNGLGPKNSGFGLYIGPKDVPPKTPPGDYFWQVWMGDGAKLSQVAVSKDKVQFKTLTYLALTFDGTNLQLFLYFPGTNQNLDSIAGAMQANVSAFTPDSTGNLFIGTGSNLYPAAGIPKQRQYPFKGTIQEVALYKVDLSAPNNQGLGKFGAHEQAGGNF
jgi:hypothetical protein